jgi:hypothetical protein
MEVLPRLRSSIASTGLLPRHVSAVIWADLTAVGGCAISGFWITFFQLMATVCLEGCARQRPPS